VTYADPAVPPAGSADLYRGNPLAEFSRLLNRIATLCWVELRKIRHDRTELYTRAIQPALWLLIYGEVFTRVHAIPTPAGIPCCGSSPPSPSWCSGRRSSPACR
jgi:ABC-2 type transport system permease protein